MTLEVVVVAVEIHRAMAFCASGRMRSAQIAMPESTDSSCRCNTPIAIITAILIYKIWENAGQH